MFVVVLDCMLFLWLVSCDWDWVMGIFVVDCCEVFDDEIVLLMMLLLNFELLLIRYVSRLRLFRFCFREIKIMK